MTLFFVGVIEMIISASWTRSVSKANVALTGAITSVNIFIWYYVIRVVVEDLHNWHAIIPYTAGCAVGSMLGAVSKEKMMKMVCRSWAALKADRPPVGKRTEDGSAMAADATNN